MCSGKLSENTNNIYKSQNSDTYSETLSAYREIFVLGSTDMYCFYYYYSVMSFCDNIKISILKILEKLILFNRELIVWKQKQALVIYF